MKKEIKILRILIAILIILNLIMCFKGMKVEAENRELKEKIENLEDKSMNEEMLEENWEHIPRID